MDKYLSFGPASTLDERYARRLLPPAAPPKARQRSSSLSATGGLLRLSCPPIMPVAGEVFRSLSDFVSNVGVGGSGGADGSGMCIASSPSASVDSAQMTAHAAQIAAVNDAGTRYANENVACGSRAQSPPHTPPQSPRLPSVHVASLSPVGAPSPSSIDINSHARTPPPRKLLTPSRRSPLQLHAFSPVGSSPVAHQASHNRTVSDTAALFLEFKSDSPRVNSPLYSDRWVR